MNKELIIDATSVEVQIALIEDKHLVELHAEQGKHDFAVGDFYLGKVKKIISGLNAAFVDVGYEKDAFLHYLDLGPHVKSLLRFQKDLMSGKNVSVENYSLDEEIDKTGKINNIISSGINILVQIAKEPISAKGPRITTELSLPGRYLVLVPFSKRISISHKIKNLAEKSRLKKIASSLQPLNFGIIVRTVAENCNFDELKADMDDLMGRWNDVVKSLKKGKSPVKILGELDRSLAIMRDLLNSSFNSIVVNDATTYNDVKSYLQSIAPEQVDIVSLYKGKTPIFEHYGVDKQIKSLFGKKVTLRSGAYLIVEHTEAFHVIDINSGYKTDNGKDQEQNALAANLEMAEEVARQIRLRDLGGIIVIDFIDMYLGANRRKLYDKLKEEMSKDRAKHSILPPSKFGLVQITRQRVRPETKIKVLERCPVCNGTGEIKSNVLIVDEIENTLFFLAKEQNEKKLTLYTSPFIHAYLTKGFFNNIVKKWRKQLNCQLTVNSSNNYHFLEYHIFNASGEEITL